MKRMPLIALALLLSMSALAERARLRPMNVNDLLRIEEIRETRFSPDGRAVVFIKSSGRRSSVWLQSAFGTAAKKIVDGEADDALWDELKWSPDSKLLALRMRYGDAAEVAVWERKTGQLSHLTKGSVALRYEWIDSQRLLCQMMASGASLDQPMSAEHAARLATEGWARAFQGREASVSVLRSGVPVDYLNEHPQGQLVLIDARAQKSRVLAQGNLRGWEIAPGRRAVAYIQQIASTRVLEPRALVVRDKLQNSQGFALRIVDSEGKSLVLHRQPLAEVLPNSVLRWASDGQSLMFLASGQSEAAPNRAYRVIIGESAAQSRLERIDPKEAVSPEESYVPAMKPDPEARLVDRSAVSGDALFLSGTNRNGQVLWRMSAAGAVQELVQANTFLRRIEEAEVKRIDYTSLRGEKLRATVLLPYGYEPGRRYPLLTWIYPGKVGGVPRGVDNRSPYNMELAAAQGYVVLSPSMPRKGGVGGNHEAEDPLLDLTNGVLPAVDQVIAAGIADPNRLAVMGQSFGGYATLGMITQTSRFNTAIAMAAGSNLISSYGTLFAVWRYDGSAYEEGLPHAFSFYETGQGAMGNPPWKDRERYIRNSPITYVDRVQTPLMIMQGDMDSCHIQNAEEFFVSLYRQGKRAEFVRYWGENHVLAHPENIRDMWMRISSWLDDTLDITREEQGELVFDGNHVKSRNGAPLQFTPESWKQLWQRERS